MSKKRRKPEEIVSKLRQVDVLASQGKTIAQAVEDWITVVGAKTATSRLEVLGKMDTTKASMRG
jgi:hypothetical protein